MRFPVPTIALVCALSGGDGSAQGRERKTLAGRVLDLRGDPVPGATVTLAHRPIAWWRDYGALDVVRVRTDDKGRFRAKLIPARPYSAFADWRSGNESIVSGVKELAAAGAFITLQQQRKAIVSIRVRVDGQEPWAKHGPLRFRVFPHTANMRPISLTPDADGTVTIPPMPGTSGTFEVLDRSGHTLWGSWIPRGRSTREGIAARSLAAGGSGSTLKLQVLKLPPPVQIPIRVVDEKTGKGVAGVKIRHRSGWLGYRVTFPVLDATDWSFDYWRPAGMTDANGNAIVTVPALGSPWPKPTRTHISFSFRAEDYAEAFGGWSSEKQFWDQQARVENPKPLRIPLKPQRPVTGRLTLDGKRPAVGLPVLLWATVHVQNVNRGGGSLWRAPVQRSITDDRGAFRFPHMGRGTGGFRIGVPLDRAATRTTLTKDGVRPPLMVTPFAEVGQKGRNGAEEAPRELGEASLGQDRAVSVRLIDPRGNPVRGARLSALPARSFQTVLAIHNTTDGSGRCLLFPGEGSQVLVTVVRDVGYAIRPLKNGDRELTLALTPFAHLEGRLLWDDGKPAVAASIRCHGTKSSGSPQGLTAEQMLVRKFACRLNYLDTRATTDEAGRFKIPYIPSTAYTMKMLAYAYRGPDMRQVEFPLDTARARDADPIEIQVVH